MVLLVNTETHEISRQGNEEVTVTSAMLNNFITEVTLIHDNLLDDSIKAIKYVVQFAAIQEQLEIISIKTNRKCWEDRGHSHWDSNNCN